MASTANSETKAGVQSICAGWNSAGETGLGWAGSLLLHLLVALMIFYFVLQHAPNIKQAQTPFIPINVVQLGERTTSRPASLRAPVPQQRPSQTSRKTPVSPGLPLATRPSSERPLPESLATRLKALSRLRMPDRTLPELESSGLSDQATTSDDARAGPEALYSVRDFVRAQVMRRWSLNWGRLGARNYIILLHVVLKRDGTVTQAEIVDRKRATTDANYRDMAISARNAVLLSSPLALPAGRYGEILDMTLKLNPRDTLQ